jgi:hypothetical protein
MRFSFRGVHIKSEPRKKPNVKEKMDATMTNVNLTVLAI